MKMKLLLGILLFLSPALVRAGECTPEMDQKIIYEDKAIVATYALTDSGDKILKITLLPLPPAGQEQEALDLTYFLQADHKDPTLKLLYAYASGKLLKSTPSHSNDETVLLGVLQMAGYNPLLSRMQGSIDSLSDCLYKAQIKQYDVVNDKGAYCKANEGQLVKFGPGLADGFAKDKIYYGPDFSLSFTPTENGQVFTACITADNELLKLGALFKPSVDADAAAAAKETADEQAAFIKSLEDFQPSRDNQVYYWYIAGEAYLVIKVGKVQWAFDNNRKNKPLIDALLATLARKKAVNENPNNK